jgi:hypothetical protein
LPTGLEEPVGKAGTKKYKEKAMNEEGKKWRLQDKAMLVNLSISMWGATKADREVTNDTNQRWGAKDQAGRYRKQLVENAFPRCKSVKGRAERFHKANTRVWTDSEDTRLLTGEDFMPYMSKMKDFEREFEKALMLDVEEWPMEITKAQKTLGAMFKREDYPSSYEVKQKFSFSVTPYPIPDSSGFAAFINTLGQEAVDAMKEDMESRLKKSSDAAFKEITTQFYALVKELAGKLQDPAFTPKEGFINSLTKYVTALPTMDFTENPDLAALRSEAEERLCGLSAETLRGSDMERTKAAVVAQDILDKMGVFWGN